MTYELPRLEHKIPEVLTLELTGIYASAKPNSEVLRAIGSKVDPNAEYHRIHRPPQHILGFGEEDRRIAILFPEVQEADFKGTIKVPGLIRVRQDSAVSSETVDDIVNAFSVFMKQRLKGQSGHYTIEKTEEGIELVRYKL